jgi:hypothetical protein
MYHYYYYHHRSEAHGSHGCLLMILHTPNPLMAARFYHFGKLQEVELEYEMMVRDNYPGA